MQIGKIVNKIFEFSFYLLFLVTPLIFNPLRSIPSFELFEWNKMVLVYIFTTFIIGLWVMRSIIASKIIFRRSPLDIPVVFFLLSQLLSTLFSIDPHVSIYGYYSRFHGGLLSTISYSLLYFAFVSNRDLLNIKKLFISMLTPGALVAIYGIAERFGIDAHLWVQDVRNRVFSTLGQPNWLAAYLAILLPITASLYFYHTYFHNQNKINKSQFLLNFFRAHGNLVYLGFSAVFYICLLFTKSRSGFLGFWISNTLFWTLIMWVNRLQIKKILSAFVFFNITLLFLNFVIQTPFNQYNQLLSVAIFEKQPKVQNPTIPTVDTVINSGVTDSADIRKIVWRGSLNIIRDYPLFGTGPETFAFAYYKYRPTEHNLTSEWDFLYNRAHNEILNILATSGLFGLVAYSILLASVTIITLWWLYKNRKMFNRTPEWLWVLGLFCGWVSISITNFLGFSVVIVALYFYLIPAIIFTIQKPLGKQSIVYKSASQESFQLLKLSIPLLPIGILLITISKFWLADSYYARSISYARQEDYAEAVSEIKKAIQIRSDEPVFYDELGINLAGLATMASDGNEATRAAELIQEAITVSSHALTISPQNVNFWKNRTKILFILSSYRPEFLDQAIAALDIALQLAPTDPKIIYNKAVLLGHAGKNIEAIELLKNTLIMKPNYKDAFIALSIFYEENNDTEQAVKTIEQALMNVNPNDAELRQRLEALSNNNK